ncbi:MAG: hypothetical protein IAG10_13945 [Planctomycetaceae bacterium]|nr:hypothetical protein [Planctomycetaceae bacterium]
MFEDKKKPKKKPEGFSLSQAFGQGGKGGKKPKKDDSNNIDFDLKGKTFSADLAKHGEATRKLSPTDPNLSPKKPTHKP